MISFRTLLVVNKDLLLLFCVIIIWEEKTLQVKAVTFFFMLKNTAARHTIFLGSKKGVYYYI